MKKVVFLLSGAMAALSMNVMALSNDHTNVSDDIVAQQRANLATNTQGKGFGPQSPRNIEAAAGTNPVVFNKAPAYTQMNLCNIHMHKNAEHAGGEFSKFAGNGDGMGYQTGYVYSGTLTKSESKPLNQAVCRSEHGGLQTGDTIEVHYVHSSAQVTPGATLGACLSDSIKNPQFRVETQVFVLVNDDKALDFGELTQHSVSNGYQQALNIPNNTGTPIEYAGSTTGPKYNEAGSPFQVTWSVRPKVAKVDINTVGTWCEGNTFEEDHAHGVRNLVTNPDLLSPMQ
ncbi:delta-class carbonic anhydrase [Neptunomonas phycophila]|uniref:delta-class carbonic anhydrase n=2 Tax=Neptunomonas phycophila TaxID=1572645 RepID=UPI0015BE54D8|nr:delta-class carbonic anhydrase [Neptunomonas phycophila]QLE98160.1 hypothetical protein FLM49_11225 [Neptunomonas phycophila]